MSFDALWELPRRRPLSKPIVCAILLVTNCYNLQDLVNAWLAADDLDKQCEIEKTIDDLLDDLLDDILKRRR
jgi:hypothetical protein